MSTLIEEIMRASETLGETRIRLFCEAIERGEVPDADLLAELARQLRAIVDGAPPRKTLEIERPQGRKQPTLVGDGHKISNAVAVERMRLQTTSYPRALEAVSEQTGKPYRTLEKHHERYKGVARFILNLEQAPQETD